ncbi:MAG: hypothetical protein AAF907_00225, partial [Planctomycetota bacterium]
MSDPATTRARTAPEAHAHGSREVWKSLLKKHWFLAALGVVIPGGLAIGWNPGSTPAAWGPPGDWFDARYLTAAVLFLMAFSL